MYDLYCQFDPDQHAATYTHYLELLIKPDGEIIYAVPSHQQAMERLVMEKHGWTRRQLEKAVPIEYWADYLTWLMKESGCISIWTEFFLGQPNEKQLAALKDLKKRGLYEGKFA